MTTSLNGLDIVQGDVYNRVRRVCVSIYGDGIVYDRLPPEVGYPFIQLGNEMSQHARNNKDYINKNKQLVIHVWQNDTNLRGDLRAMLEEIETGIVNEFGHQCENIGINIETDDTTSTLLLHGVMDVEFRI